MECSNVQTDEDHHQKPLTLIENRVIDSHEMNIENSSFWSMGRLKRNVETRSMSNMK